MSLARPKTREEWRQHWDVVTWCWHVEEPLRARQELVKFERERMRCQACGWPPSETTSIRCEKDGDEVVLLCEVHELADTIPPKYVLFSWQATPGVSS